MKCSKTVSFLAVYSHWCFGVARDNFERLNDESEVKLRSNLRW